MDTSRVDGVEDDAAMQHDRAVKFDFHAGWVHPWNSYEPKAAKAHLYYAPTLSG